VTSPGKGREKKDVTLLSTNADPGNQKEKNLQEKRKERGKGGRSGACLDNHRRKGKKKRAVRGFALKDNRGI